MCCDSTVSDVNKLCGLGTVRDLGWDTKNGSLDSHNAS